MHVQFKESKMKLLATLLFFSVVGKIFDLHLVVKIVAAGANYGAPFSTETIFTKFQRTRIRKKFLRRRFLFCSGNEASYNPTVITNSEAHMVNLNMENSKTTTGKTKRKVDITNYFSKASSTGK